MDYKRIIKNRSNRLRILRFFSFLPDKTMVRIQYRIKTGRKLDLKKPRRFTEKLQWYKLFYKNPLMVQCVDKYDVRGYVKSKGLEEILIPCIGVYDCADDINWEKLPDQFVMKDTLGAGGNSVIIEDNRNKRDYEKLMRCAKAWVETPTNKKDGGREWPYYSGKNHRIIIEQYLWPNNRQGLIEYKFFCFQGEPHYIYVIADREIGNGAALGIFDAEFNRIKAYRADERRLKKKIEKPKCFEKMKYIARTLSSDFPEVRIDMYEVDGKVYFGEMTFFDGSGYMRFNPDRFDLWLGKKFELPKKWV